MKIKLNKQCRVQELESKKERLGKALLGKKGKIIIDVSNLEKVDTAFLQTLLSILESCKLSGRKYEVRGKSEVFDLILECYGIKI